MTNQNVIYVNNRPIAIEGESNILEVIRKAGIKIPTLCYNPSLRSYGACRLCIVEVEGRGILTSCTTAPEPGMKVHTHTPEIKKIRKITAELLLANHKVECPTCDQMGKCKLEDIAHELGVDDVRYKPLEKCSPVNDTSYAIVVDRDKCVLCGQCVRFCDEIHGVGAIDFSYRGSNTVVSTAFNKDFTETECVNCGQCAAVCPVGAITVKKHINPVNKYLEDPSKTVVIQVAPAVRAGIGEEFGLKPSEDVTGKMVTALKMLGFDYVYDTTFTADLTIAEEATEFLTRVKNNGVIPQFTSCCPAWVKFLEQYYPELIPNLSSCKSPQQMFSAVVREILPEKLNVKKEDLVFISLMPCTAKKFEIRRPEFEYEKGKRDIDEVITTQEFARMIKAAGIDFANLKPEEFDMPYGEKTGAGVIFGVTGGVTEAALRMAAEELTGQKLEGKELEFEAVRGSEGLKEANLKVGGVDLNIAIVHGLANAHEVCKEIIDGKSKYHFIEVMTCPGGCINGGGQPIDFNQPEKIARRTDGLYTADKNMPLRKSQDNPAMKELYKDHLGGKPNSEKAEELLHTTYYKRDY